ncbi:serine/threonine-protein kinase [Sphaerisporangium sp. B11E5]|uniref:serine/threonine-protein kinase n=1 Tax=Sphaerisporangium sp. B11E5 TaxID=3153563 RepID=UPI00325E77B3
MPQVLPLQSDDPSELGAYHIVGRIGEGARSIVYLAKGPSSSDHVAIKLLHEDTHGAEGFLAKIEELRQVSAFCTAQVLETGQSGGRPYVVSEYIDGPTLQAAVETDGPLRGPALHRLAIGTMTALVAIHQAGVVHREFSPTSVLLGPDGPRVIDFGIAQALDAGMESTTRSVGTPAYLTPEQLEGAPIGPAADMFAWGATMLFAASGRAPFDAGSMSATINRVLRDEPDLSVLDDDLLNLVAGCLAKDPTRRPSASEALLRLVGHSQILATLEAPAAEPARPPADPSAAPPPPAALGAPQAPAALGTPPPPDPASRVDFLPPPSRPAAGRRRGLMLTAAAVAIAVVSGGTVYALTGRPAPAPRPTTQAAPPPTPLPAPSASVIEASPSPPPKATKKITTPDVPITVHEHPSDPVRLVSYFVQDNDKKQYASYVRDLGKDTFTVVGRNADFGDPTVSPDGNWVAVNPWLKFAASNYDSAGFINRTTGEKFSVDTLKEPLRGLSGTWSRDSRHYLLTVYNFDVDKETQYPAGFVVVDVQTRKATAVMTDDERDGYGNFDFSPDGTTVAGAYEGKGKVRFGLRFRTLDGKVGRTMPWVGLIPGPGLFSPSGTSFYTYCPDKNSDSGICVWNLASGNRTATIPSFSDEASVQGWWDEGHLIVYDPRKETKKYVVIDFHGKIQRTLVEVDKKAKDITHQLRFAAK